MNPITLGTSAVPGGLDHTVTLSNDQVALTDWEGVRIQVDKADSLDTRNLVYLDATRPRGDRVTLDIDPKQAAYLALFLTRSLAYGARKSGGTREAFTILAEGLVEFEGEFKEQGTRNVVEAFLATPSVGGLAPTIDR